MPKSNLQGDKRRKQNNLCVLKADKGKLTVIMDRDQYNNGILKIIKDCGHTSWTLTEKCNRAVRKVLNNTVNMFFSLKLLSFGSMHYALWDTKVHKQDSPLRPIVAFSSVPTARISRKIAEKDKEINNFKENIA